jgi:hypothetical protein
MNYGVTFAVYTASGGKLDEATFNLLIAPAVKKLDILTHYRAQELEATDYRYLQTQEAVCRLIDQMKVQEQTAQGTGVKSVSNDGYSESYEAATPAQAAQQLREVCLAALSGTGLMSVL